MKQLFSLLLCVSLLTTSCKQKDILTEGEKTAQTINAVVKQNNILRASITYGSNNYVQNASFQIEGQFLIYTMSGETGRRYMNLSKLIRFEVSRLFTGENYIYFYFE